MIVSAAVPFNAALSEARLTKTGLISYKGVTGESAGRPQAYAMVKSLLVEPRFSAFCMQSDGNADPFWTACFCWRTVVAHTASQSHMSQALPSLESLKDQAKRLRARLQAEGQEISHSKSLELIAAQMGFRDWNTLHARVGNRPPFNPYLLGSRVRGFYLGQAFEAEVLGVQSLGGSPERYRLTLHFDQPVDVVTFESFSAFRQRVHCNVDGTGRTTEKTSNGRPQVELVW